MSRGGKEVDSGVLPGGMLMLSTSRVSVREMEGRNMLAFLVVRAKGVPMDKDTNPVFAWYAMGAGVVSLFNMYRWLITEGVGSFLSGGWFSSVIEGLIWPITLFQLMTS